MVGPAPRQLLGPGDALNFAPVPLLLLDQTLAGHDLLVRERAVVALDRLRRSGTTTLVVSHDEDLLRRLADEVWWLQEGKLAARGAPDEVLGAYRKHIAHRIRAWGDTVTAPLARASAGATAGPRCCAWRPIGEQGRPTSVWRSGELAVVRVTVRFHQAVEDPVIGILIRTRIGLNVYGTNTELEKLKLGPCAAGETLQLTFAFRCELCPGHYTLTVPRTIRMACGTTGWRMRWLSRFRHTVHGGSGQPARHRDVRTFVARRSKARRPGRPHYLNACSLRRPLRWSPWILKT